jgi:putative peptidoglycan lipid II flippase
VLVLDGGYVGIALSTAAAAWVNVVLLYWTLHRRDHLRLDARMRRTGVRILLASAAMGLALWLGSELLDTHMATGFWERIAALSILCGAGAAVYGIAALALGAVSLSELRGQFSRKR